MDHSKFVLNRRKSPLVDKGPQDIESVCKHSLKRLSLQLWTFFDFFIFVLNHLQK